MGDSKRERQAFLDPMDSAFWTQKMVYPELLCVTGTKIRLDSYRLTGKREQWILPEPIIEVPYPNDVVVSGDKLLIVSTICCQDSMEPLRKAHLYDSTGALLKTAKDLPNGERMDYPNKVAVDEAGNFLVVDTGLKKTLLFSPDLEYIGDLPELGVPDAMDFYDNKVYTLSRTIHSDRTDHKVMVYSYQY